MNTTKVIAVLGYYIVRETTRFNKGQEFAGAVDTVEVQPGRYPIELRSNGRGVYIGASLPGILVYSAWFGTNTRVSEPMTPDSYSWQPRDYELAGMAAEGNPHIELAEGVTLAGRQYVNKGVGDRPDQFKVLWTLVKDGKPVHTR